MEAKERMATEVKKKGITGQEWRHTHQLWASAGKWGVVVTASRKVEERESRNKDIRFQF